jgi:hypothetical protein
MPIGRWPMFAGPRGTYGGFELLGRTLLPRTPLVGAIRGTFWGGGPFVCAVLIQIPIASTATNQSAGNLDNFIKFLCPLNIIYHLLLQVSTGTASKLFRPCSCNPQSEIYNLQFFTGVLAQLVERLNGINARLIFPLYPDLI